MNIFRSYKCLNVKYCFLPQKTFSTSHGVEKYSKTIWDVIISGGGMVGCALAASISKSPILQGKKVLLLESSTKTDFKIDPEVYSNRVCALNPSTKKLFETLGAWKTICSIRMKEVKKMVVWESCCDARISFDRDDPDEGGVAYIVENDVILTSLWTALAGLPAHVATGTRATDVRMTDGEDGLVTVRLQDGTEIRTKLLVGADGVNSFVRSKMGAKNSSFSYNQKGIVATLRLAEPTENTVAWQRFLPTGPVALLPLRDDLCSLVWTVSARMCDELLTSPEEQFVDALNSALWSEDGKNSFVETAITNMRQLISNLAPGTPSRQLPPSILSLQPGSRAAFPLGLGHSDQYVADRMALVGDSAHRVHPLAGQGVNLGFGDVKELTECLEETAYTGEDIGSLPSLLEYERRRQRHVLPTMAAIDALCRIYGTEFAPLVLIRGLGVTAIDACPPIKAFMMRQASV